MCDWTGFHTFSVSPFRANPLLTIGTSPEPRPDTSGSDLGESGAERGMRGEEWSGKVKRGRREDAAEGGGGARKEKE